MNEISLYCIIISLICLLIAACDKLWTDHNAMLKAIRTLKMAREGEELHVVERNRWRKERNEYKIEIKRLTDLSGVKNV